MLLWLARTTIAVQFARSYFESHGVTSSVEIGALGLSGVSARFSLGPKDAPELSAERIPHFDPLRWMPYVTEVRLVNPVVRAAVDESGKVSLGSLQAWYFHFLLRQQQGKSRFVSDDLAVSLRGLRLLLATPAGPLEVDGDVQLVKNLPVLVALSAKPANIAYRDIKVAMQSANLSFDQKAATVERAIFRVVANPVFEAQGLVVRAEASGLKWTTADGRLSVAASSAHVQAGANSLAVGQAVRAPRLNAELRDLSLVSANGPEAGGDIVAAVEFGLDAALSSVRATDPALATVLRRNLDWLTATFAGHAAASGAAAHSALI